jgi:hypothetical protein
MTTSTRTDRIRALNDDLRQHLIGGGTVITPGIAALGREALDRIVKTIAVYDDFCHGNDPYGEHDFGLFEADGKTISCAQGGYSIVDLLTPYQAPVGCFWMPWPIRRDVAYWHFAEMSVA